MRQAIEMTALVNPIHSAILVGITDEKTPQFFEDVPNDDGGFQIIAGCTSTESDAQLADDVFNILHRAAMACPFSNADRHLVDKVFEQFEASFKDDSPR
ncbi:MAG: hypothetical protein K8T25_13370 [Planctomycetia bacterium]|nr:hypothetical protein [Planctomycetia bacterium]